MPLADKAAVFDAALGALLQHLREQAYEFVTVTPQSHARVLANRESRTGTSLRDAFGWSLPFSPSLLPDGLPDLLLQTGVLVPEGALLRSQVRVSSFDGDLFAHSAYPATEPDAVFFGPDTYRFLNLVREHMPAALPDTPLRIADVGCGTGAGGIVAARLRVGSRVVLHDNNPLALRYAGINAASAGLDLDLAPGNALQAGAGNFHVVLASPPGPEEDTSHAPAGPAPALNVKMGAEGLQRLLPGGCLILYTGVAIMDGVDPFIREMEPFLGQAGCTYTYAEIDPDVFGEKLERPAWRHADRIAAVGLVAVKP